LKVTKLKSHWEYTMLQCKQLAYDMNIDMKVLDLGGGLGISYQDEQELSFPEVHTMLLELKEQFELKEVWLELGRYSIGKFGKNLIVTEGGINHMARPALVNESFPCQAFGKSGSEMKSYAVHGPLCTALDKLGEFSLPSDLNVGDWLEFKRAGAYGFSESMPYFLCHNLVGEAVVYRGELSMPRVPKTNLEWMV
jgi:diaminopimelate decarboxylase